MTALINNLYALAEAEKDYASRDRLNWFVNEQVEEEDNCRQLIDKFSLIGDNGMGLYMLDYNSAPAYTPLPQLLPNKQTIKHSIIKTTPEATAPSVVFVTYFTIKQPVTKVSSDLVSFFLLITLLQIKILLKFAS